MSVHVYVDVARVIPNSGSSRFLSPLSRCSFEYVIRWFLATIRLQKCERELIGDMIAFTRACLGVCCSESGYAYFAFSDGCNLYAKRDVRHSVILSEILLSQSATR